MEHYAVIMRRKHQEFLRYSFALKLCSALLCPDQTHEKDLKRRMP